MIIANEIHSKYSDYIKLAKVLGNLVNATLMNYCEKKSYPFIWRYKSIESISEKIESGRFQSWEDINDIYACTIIIPNLNDEENVINDLRKYFNIIKILDRGNTPKPPEVFRFDSTRIIATINDYTESKPIAKLKFEIQIKSAFEYAWSITTHSLTYKTRKPDWKRYRLAAQLKASVEQLDTLVLGFEDMADKIKVSFNQLCEEKSFLSETVERLFNDRIIPEEYYPKDMSRNCENMLNLLYASNLHKKTNIKNKLFFIMQYFEYWLTQSKYLPRSLSLFQLFFCCLVQGNYIIRLTPNYCPIITEEMKQFFPVTAKYSNNFKFINVA